jgi:hypothetical protein
MATTGNFPECLAPILVYDPPPTDACPPVDKLLIIQENAAFDCFSIHNFKMIS